MRGIIVYLRHGMVYYHYAYGDIPEEGEGSGEYGPVNHMTPITPVRLFEGGIVGKERIVTCISEVFVWEHAEEPAVTTFDPRGRERESTARVERRGGNTWRIAVELADWEEIAVIE